MDLFGFVPERTLLVLQRPFRIPKIKRRSASLAYCFHHLSSCALRSVVAGQESMMPIPNSNMRERRGGFFYLFLTELALLILYPYLETKGLPVVTFRLLTTLALVSAIFAVSHKRARWLLGLLLALPAGVMNAIIALRPDTRIEVPTLVLTLAFLVFTLATLFKAVVSTREITMDTIYGAISVYLLIGLAWAVAYRLLSTVQPEAFAAVVTSHLSRTVNWSDCLFFSFVTLTSTGYGDIVPMTAHARSLAMLESVSGTMYMAVLVARLVGVYVAVAPKQSDGDGDGGSALRQVTGQ
jgi:hypothetical protein